MMASNFQDTFKKFLKDMAKIQTIPGNDRLIRRQLESFVKAFKNKDLELMMSLFSQEMVSFDIIPPLHYVGAESYRKVWQETFSLFEDPIDIELSDIQIVADAQVAFSYCFLHLSATLTNGRKTDFWERLTCCFQKIDDRWQILHEHVSLPINLQTGQAAMDLLPDTSQR